MQTTFPVDRLEGMVVGGYKIERLLNHGKLGTVYIARKDGQEQPVMITFFSVPETFTDSARSLFLVRFSQVSRKLVRLRHPSILPLYGCGQYTDYPYLISAFARGKSLAQIIKQEPPFSAQQILRILKQVGVGLEVVHEVGSFHGLLNASNIIVDDAQEIQLAGLGLRPILEIYDIEPAQPYGHLYSIAGTFLGSSAYLAPECAQNGPIDARSDIYSLGIVAFELLTGIPPFNTKDQLTSVLRRAQEPIPSVQVVRASVPVEFDAVIRRALQPDPANRYHSALDLVDAFEQVVQELKAARQPQGRQRANEVKKSELTLSPTVNWFEDEDAGHALGTSVPNTTIGYLSSVQRASDGRLAAQPDRSRAIGNAGSDGVSRRREADGQPAQVVGKEDPFALWSTSSARMAVPDMVRSSTARRTAASDSRKMEVPHAQAITRPAKRGPANPQRRRVVALLATGGGVIAAGALAYEGLNLAHLLPHAQVAQVVNPPQTQKTQGNGNKNTTGKNGKTQGQTNNKQGNQKPAQPTQAPQQHTGTVVGSSTLAVNSAKTFKNPANGNESLLIHLPNGNFVASDRACTHEGVAVNYHADTQKLVCPLHGAIFDPANNFSVVQGPARLPLPKVAIKVNADGTITAM
jgi:serine/threonine protein kinase/Rieske Fe-S protein